MKLAKILRQQTVVLIGILSISSFDVRAQNVSRAGQTDAEKPFIVNMSVRGEYDDNVNTSATREDAAWILNLRPSVSFRYPLENTQIQGGYTFGFKQFFGREGDDEEDFSHSFNAVINHRFTSRFAVEVRENFSFAQEDSLSDGAGFQRRSGGDRIRNTGSILATYDWTERFTTTTEYQNTLVNYFDQPASGVNNYLGHRVSQQLRFQALRTTTPFLSYVFETIDYNTIDRDRDEHLAIVGVDHYILDEWLVSAQVGAEFVQYDNSLFNDSVGPYASLRTIWNYLPRSNVSAGYSFGTNVTDNANFASQESHTFDLEINHYFTQKLSAGISTQYQLSQFDTSQGFSTATSNVDEHTISVGVNARYEFANYLSADIGYRYSEVISDTAVREYNRNQVFFGISGAY